jgi:hypothetical protein
MFRLLLLYSIIYFCRTGDYIPFVGKVALLDTIRHELLVAVMVLITIIFNGNGQRNVAVAFQNDAWKTYTFFVILTFFSIPFSVWPGNAFDWFVDFFKLFLFCVMVVACIQTEDEFNKFILLYIVCMVYIAYGPLQNYLTGTFMYDYSGGTVTERIGSPIRFYGNPNVLAITLLQCVPFIYYRITYNGLFQKVVVNSIWLGIIVLLLFIVIVTGSRGGFLVLGGMVLLIGYRSPYRWSALTSGFVLFVIMWFWMGEEYQTRYMTISELGQSDKSASDRILGLQHGFMMLLSHPILGVGIGCYHIARWHMFENILWAHNLLGQLMGDLGILGTVTFLVLLYQSFKNTRYTRRILTENSMESSLLYYQAMALEASLFAQIINGIGQHSLYLFGFYVMGTLTVIIQRITEKMVREQSKGKKSSERGRTQ